MYFGSSESLHVPAQYITFDSHVYHQKSLFTLLVLIFGSFLLYYCLIIIIITLLKNTKNMLVFIGILKNALRADSCAIE